MACYRKSFSIADFLKKLIYVTVFGASFIFIIICVINCQSEFSRRTITFCVPPAAPLHGQVSIGSVVTRFICNPGHKLDGSPVAVCVGGRWSTAVPTCVAVEGKSKKTKIKGDMDVELKDQQIVTAYTHFPKSSQTDRSKSSKRKIRWKKKRRKYRRKKSKGKTNQISQPKKYSPGQKVASNLAKGGTKRVKEKRKNKLSKKERRMRRRQERKRKKKRKDKKRRKSGRKHRKRKKFRDKNKNKIIVDKLKKKKNDKPLHKPEINSIHFSNSDDQKQFEKHENALEANSTMIGILPKVIKITSTTPQIVIQSANETRNTSITNKTTNSMKTDGHLINYMYGVYNVNASKNSTRVDIVPTQTPKTDLLQEIIDRMKTRDDNTVSNLLDDDLILKVENDMKKVRPSSKSKNDVRLSNSENNQSYKKRKKYSGKIITDYESDYDPEEYPDYFGIGLNSQNSSVDGSTMEQALPDGYPSLEYRLFGRNEIHQPRERFIEEEDIAFSELDTTCTISEADSIYLQPPRVKNGHITAYITVTNPAPPNNVYVEANYDCNFGYQLTEPTNSRLFCRKNSWIGMLPSCTPYVITGGGVCAEENGGCQHICNPEDNNTFKCSCYRGFTLNEDKVSCKDVNECASNNGGCEGACFNKLGSYQCYCPKGYRVATNGKTCVDRNECNLRNGHGPCQDTCFNTEGSYYCTCDGRPGTSLASDKHTCEDLDECAVDNGGCSHICLNTFGQTFCSCPEGFSLSMDWKTCVDINECDYPHIAKECDLGCVNTLGSYRCAVPQDSILEILCQDGEKLSSNGMECEDIDECKGSHGCSHECVKTEGSFSCACPTGRTLSSDHKTCIDLHECEGNHGCSHDCVNTEGSFNCACPTGRTLAPDHKTCIDLDECEGNHGCSHECVNTEGSFNCACPTGRTISPDHKTCIDLDECEGNHGCSHECVNTEGSFNCACPIGRILAPDHKTCIDVNECLDRNGGCEQICVNLDGSHQCQCQPGFVLMQDHTCADVDECQSNNAGCDQICTNEAGTFHCSCYNGYDEEGSKCTDIDECDLKLAKCQQACSNFNGSYECLCYDGYELNHDGVSCRDVDECSKENFCSHFCSNKNGSFACSCPAGWSLAEDERTCIDIDECQNSKCSHECHNTDGGYTCSCPSGLRLISEGTATEKTHLCVDIDECIINNGNCSQICNNLEGSFECSCSEGFVKVTKQNVTKCTDINECHDNNGGCSHICVNQDGNFRCDCSIGLELDEDGLYCIDVDECLKDNGECSHSCVNLPGTYECTCPAGWEMNIDYYKDYDSNEVYFEGLEPSWKTCTDIDECNINNGACSHECVNEHGSYYCACPTGYNMINDYTCADINECMVGTGPCSHSCMNMPGTFKCECATGFELIDDIKCQDVNECLYEKVCSHDCVNQLGTYKCICPVGLVMELDNKTCSDFNECGDSNGGCSHTCKNTDGLYGCSCPRGMALATDLHTCEDVDECEDKNGGCSHTCLNANGSYSCSCTQGLMLAIDSKSCLDIDECGIENGGCSHQCTNHEGHYKCLCPLGTQLQKDGHTCQDIDECSTNNSGCSHKCYNLHGTYECLCPEGYILEMNNHTCHDVDECDLNNGGCQENCHNTRGSFRCDCQRGGYQLASNLKSCVDIDECSLANAGCSHFCENMPGSFICSCPLGYNLDTDGFQCIDVDECKFRPCEHDCINTEGSYYCGCDKGYSSRPDSANLCHDINECEIKNGGCGHDCFNTIGSHYCKCRTGFHLTTNNHSCEEKKIFCPLLNAPMGSSMICSAEPIAIAYKAGTKCSFSCQKGSTLEGNNSSTCDVNGLWTNVLPSCKDIFCPGVPNIEFGAITPYRCLQGTSKLNQHCYLTCNQGYRVVGNPVRTCRDPGTWMPTISAHCAKDTLKPFIQCPSDMTVELSPHQNVAYVRLPRPKSNVDWYRFIDSSHDWAKELEADIPAGATVVTFTAHSPVSDAKDSCTFEIFVKDTEIPQVFGCPKSFKLYLTKDEDATEVVWKEPVFKDNVEVVHIYKSMEPGTKLEIGRHPVHYIAVDPQGNRAKCSFVVTVEEDPPLDEPTEQSVRKGKCGLYPGPIPGGMWVCNDWEWGRICRPNCPPSKVLINPSSNLLFMCVFSSGTWNPDAINIYSRPACSRSTAVKRGLDCMLGYEREKTNAGACLACTPGMYRSESFDRCVPCQVGYYSHTFGSSKCKQCPRRYTTKNIGTYTRSLCVRRDGHIKRKELPQPHFTKEAWTFDG